MQRRDGLVATAPAASATAPTPAGDTSAGAVIPINRAGRTAGVTSHDIAWPVATRDSKETWTLGPLQTWRTRTTAQSASGPVIARQGSPTRETGAVGPEWSGPTLRRPAKTISHRSRECA
ncbi:hypothetical protein ABZ153_03315 [Streptomyces sp. NPDC006290]|uniref:hypothetical protein n=1 Tax=Streptomyces sp. NPDC006290 TaxID=3156745 RepID=UPI0033B79D5A